MPEDLRALDLRHLWHPYTPIDAFEADDDVPVIARAEGVRLYDAAGRAWLDGISSWWAVNLGHGHPRIVEAIRAQAGTLQHSILGGMSHPNAARLAARLAAAAPGALNRVLFASDGASAVEAALKIALQYRTNRGEAGRDRFVSLADAYHGDTLGAMGPGHLPGFHRPFEKVLTPAFRAASPHCFHCPCGLAPETCDVECFASMAEAVRQNADRVTAVIVEPLCQGAAGMRIYPAAYLRRLRALCDETGALLIADEIAVGFGRTGKLFACEHAGIAPDILCLGKALTGGALPMSATVVTDAVYDTFRNTRERDRTFYHGHTFCGNPIAAAAALAALDVFAGEKIVEQARPAMDALAAGIADLGARPPVARARALGMMGVLEIAPEAGGEDAAKATARKALARDLFIRPLDNIVYLWPPLVTSKEDIGKMLTRLADSLP